ncbi:MAG TPA: MFS transporter, partial [Pontiellaceae bacterium]|nr:MFS transporter [Pontiellaceae bacterium]
LSGLRGAVIRQKCRIRSLKHTEDDVRDSKGSSSKSGYNRFLLLVAGLGGLLYGIDVGIISGALPYLEATFKDSATGQSLTAGNLSFIVAAVLLGSVISTLFAGVLSDWMGRKKLMFLSGLLFVVSIPVIALSSGYSSLVLGRLLQGVSAGLIGVVVPLYLAECLGAANRGKGTGVFQWLLTLGIVAAAGIGYYFSQEVAQIEKLQDAAKLFAFKDTAWRSIFWVSLPPGLLFVIGSLLVAESPRWLFRKGRKEAALAALLRSRTDEQAHNELREMEETAAAEKAQTNSAGAKIKESLLRRKYVIPFVLACVILACNQATGVNSIIGYNATILIQAGLSDANAHLGYVILTLVNFLVTMAGVALVDKKGRKFLLSLGSSGIIISLIFAGLVFHKNEKARVDVKEAVQAMVIESNQTASIDFNNEVAAKLMADKGGAANRQSATMVVIYSYGDFHAASKVVRSDDIAAKIEISRASCVPVNKVAAFFQNPFADLDAARVAPLKIDNALITPVPSEKSGWLTAICIFCFMAFFAIGPGVCVWLALSELMPTRIRSNGMSIALLVNQAVSTSIAAVFLPTVGKYGYGTMFFVFAGCTVVYFITATFFLPETKGKTLEEIEEHFEGGK